MIMRPIPVLIRPLCQTFQLLALKTWTDLGDAFKNKLWFGEETITDYNLLHLKRSHSREIYIQKYKRREEADYGADWIWWFGAHDGWFGMRIQAKRLDSESRKYNGIKKKIKKRNKLQINMLIERAKIDGLVPLYCFYNYWETYHFTPKWNCKSFPLQAEHLGCAIAYAEDVKKVMKHNTPLADINAISWPWMCLSCCIGHSRNSMTLPHRAHDFINGELARGRKIPDVLDRQPFIVTKIIGPQDSKNNVLENDDPTLAGILIIRESE